MRKILFTFLWLLVGIMVFAVFYFTADAVLSRIGSKVHSSDNSKKYDVYVMSNGVHTDIVFPVKTDIIDWMTIFPPTNNLRQDSIYKYVAIGWGDKGFYLNTPEWKDLTAKTAIVAALGLGETALHVTYYKTIVEDSLTYKVAIDSMQFIKLKNYVLASCSQDENGNAIVIQTQAQYGNSDAFYEARGAYSMFHSCNTWANNCLKSANMPAAVWTVFDKGILRHYKHIK